MIVYYVHYNQGEEAICSNLESAKEKLKKMITDYQIKKYGKAIENDPNPWIDWAWWQEDNIWYFGIMDTILQCAEGYVKEFVVED